MKQFMERKSMKHEAHKRARNTMKVSRLHCKYLPSEKLDRSNYSSWEYEMTQYLVGQGYWSYINGAQEN